VPGSCEHGNEPLAENFLTSWVTISLLRRIMLRGVGELNENEKEKGSGLEGPFRCYVNIEPEAHTW